MDVKQQEEIKKDLLLKKEELLNEMNKSREGMYLPQDQAELADFTDQSSMESDRNFQLRLNERGVFLLKKIETALDKIKSNDYGTCEECGCDINLERLKARPVVTMCIDCKTEQEKQEKITSSG